MPKDEKRCKCGHLARWHDKWWPNQCSICIRRWGRSDDVCDGQVRNAEG